MNDITEKNKYSAKKMLEEGEIHIFWNFEFGIQPVKDFSKERLFRELPENIQGKKTL